MRIINTNRKCFRCFITSSQESHNGGKSKQKRRKPPRYKFVAENGKHFGTRGFVYALIFHLKNWLAFWSFNRCRDLLNLTQFSNRFLAFHRLFRLFIAQNFPCCLSHFRSLKDSYRPRTGSNLIFSAKGNSSFSWNFLTLLFLASCCGKLENSSRKNGTKIHIWEWWASNNWLAFFLLIFLAR